MEPSGFVSTVKEGLALKLETPYMIAASTIGVLSVWCMAPGDEPFSRPFEGLAKFFAWTGWASPVAWLNTAHQWVSDPSRIEATHGVFVVLALFGTFFGPTAGHRLRRWSALAGWWKRGL